MDLWGNILLRVRKYTRWYDTCMRLHACTFVQLAQRSTKKHVSCNYSSSTYAHCIQQLVSVWAHEQNAGCTIGCSHAHIIKYIALLLLTVPLR